MYYIHKWSYLIYKKFEGDEKLYVYYEKHKDTGYTWIHIVHHMSYGDFFTVDSNMYLRHLDEYTKDMGDSHKDYIARYKNIVIKYLLKNDFYSDVLE